MQTMSTQEALLLLVFRCARSNRHANLTAFCKRARCSVVELEAALQSLEQRGLLSIDLRGEHLTLEGLAVGAALARRAAAERRPLAACRSLAA